MKELCYQDDMFSTRARVRYGPTTGSSRGDERGVTSPDSAARSGTPFSTRARIRYGPTPVGAQSTREKETSSSDPHSVGSNESNHEAAARDAVIPHGIDDTEFMVNLHGFQTALALPASDQYKSQLVIQTAESLNHIRMGRSDAQASLAKVLLQACAASIENPSWQLYRQRQLTPLQVTVALNSTNGVCSEPLRFTHGALAGQSWSLKQLKDLPKELYPETFSNVCLTYHATLQQWYQQMCSNSLSPPEHAEMKQKIGTLVLEHRALCFALTFLDFSTTNAHHMWPALPAQYFPSIDNWLYLMDRISLSPCQLEQFVTTRAWADNMLTEIDMCCALFKLQIETKLAGAQILVDDVQLLEAVESLNDSNNRRQVVSVQVANIILFQILDPEQAGLLVSALQVDIVKRPVYAWLDWIRLLSSSLISAESKWTDVYVCKEG